MKEGGYKDGEGNGWNLVFARCDGLLKFLEVDVADMIAKARRYFLVRRAVVASSAFVRGEVMGTHHKGPPPGLVRISLYSAHTSSLQSLRRSSRNDALTKRRTSM